jgi:hypothetical protein
MVKNLITYRISIYCVNQTYQTKIPGFGTTKLSFLVVEKTANGTIVPEKASLA